MFCYILISLYRCYFGAGNNEPRSENQKNVLKSTVTIINNTKKKKLQLILVHEAFHLLNCVTYAVY